LRCWAVAGPRVSTRTSTSEDFTGTSRNRRWLVISTLLPRSPIHRVAGEHAGRIAISARSRINRPSRARPRHQDDDSSRPVDVGAAPQVATRRQRRTAAAGLRRAASGRRPALDYQVSPVDQQWIAARCASSGHQQDVVDPPPPDQRQGALAGRLTAMHSSGSRFARTRRGAAKRPRASTGRQRPRADHEDRGLARLGGERDAADQSRTDRNKSTSTDRAHRPAARERSCLGRRSGVRRVGGTMVRRLAARARSGGALCAEVSRIEQHAGAEQQPVRSTFHEHGWLRASQCVPHTSRGLVARPLRAAARSR